MKTIELSDKKSVLHVDYTSRYNFLTLKVAFKKSTLISSVNVWHVTPKVLKRFARFVEQQFSDFDVVDEFAFKDTLCFIETYTHILVPDLYGCKLQFTSKIGEVNTIISFNISQITRDDIMKFVNALKDYANENS